MRKYIIYKRVIGTYLRLRAVYTNRKERYTALHRLNGLRGRKKKQ